MCEQIEPVAPAPDALEALAAVFKGQALDLDRIFKRAVVHAARRDSRSHRNARLALNAQARCRTTFKVLLALRAARGPAEKISKSNEQTDDSGKSSV